MIFISGPSGVGKTTVGKLAKHIAEQNGISTKFIDQDEFYKKHKPPVQLSNNSTTSNWDCVGAIDWDALNQSLTITRDQYQLTILVGFALLDDLIMEKPDAHYLITYDVPDTELLDVIVASRKKSKKFNNRQAKRDVLMVREVVLPFYLETLDRIGEPYETIKRGNAESTALHIFRQFRISKE